LAAPFDLIIVGAGAAGHFAAAELLRLRPEASVLMLEKSPQVLAKVRISGGGRCNVTHHCFENARLIEHYPRGNPWLKDAFEQFSVQDTLRWFQSRGVRIVAEADGRMFPESNQSESIVKVLREAAQGDRFQLRTQTLVEQIVKERDGFTLTLKGGEVLKSTCLLLASGGSPGDAGMQYLSGLGLKRIPPVPSLFTFNIKEHPWSGLMGLVVEDARASLSSGSLSFRGPVLVTHWGFSGPAILKLSAAAARLLNDCQYQFEFEIDFLPELTASRVMEKLQEQASLNPRQKPLNAQVFALPRRLWEQLCAESGLASYHNWAESGKKTFQKMTALLKGRKFQASGKTTFKDEFVTAGGIALESVDSKTCESKQHAGLFFAGEILDVDGFTGGFNFQAAWSTAHAAAMEISDRVN
jgi:predicted Rossmann fold flavoprotein